MKNTLVKSKSHSTKQASDRNAATVIKVVVFQVGQVNLALHIDSIAKVLPQTTVHGSRLHSVGLAHLGDRDVTVVDLHQRLFQSSSINDTVKYNYLMIVKSRQGELYGIPVPVVPTLMDLPLSYIRVLPESYRNGDIFGFATHVAVIPTTEPPMTIFLVDIDQLLSAGS